MMNWDNRGLIFSIKNKFNWAEHSALVPTPIVIDNFIRVFIGARDNTGISRIGWVDLDLENPEEILAASQKPVLDIGLPGTFDDNGVVPTFVYRHENKLYLFYAGYQLLQKVRFTVFTGLAISEDNGLSFKRYQNTPITERTNDEFLFRVIHSIIHENGIYKIWYGAGKSFQSGKSKTLPKYDIKYMETTSLLSFPTESQTVLVCGEGEYRLGRPYVILHEKIYYMFFGASNEKTDYRLAFAESKNGIDWTRNDSRLNFKTENDSFDSQMNAFPSVILHKDKIYLFYNGNEFGKEGFGLSILHKLKF